jgi:hypothetical protein
MLDRYLTALAKQLPLAPAARNDILREVRSHLEEAARALQAAGLSKTESEVKAMERFGDAAAIGRELREVHGGTQREAALAACAFALFALLAELPHLLALFWGVHVGSLFTFQAMVALFLAASVWAWRAHFPLWSYPWVGFAGVLLLYLGMLRGQSFYFLAVFLAPGLGVVFLATTWRWLQADWTVGSLLFSPAAPMMAWLTFDGKPASFQAPFILGIGLLCAVTALAFVRAGSPRRRMAVTLAGAAATVLASFLPVSYYDFFIRQHVLTLEGTVAVTVGMILGLWALLLSPALLGLARRVLVAE